MKKKYNQYQREIKINNYKVDNGLNEDFIRIISSNSGKLTPFTKLFKEQQKCLFTSPSSWVRYHPAIIRFCLLICSSKIAFYLGGNTQCQHFTTSKCTLPKRLKKKKKFIQPKRGFWKNVVDNLIKRTSGLNGANRFVALILDEMKIKGNLIFVKHTGSLIGFIDLRDVHINTLNFEKKEDLATNGLVYFGRGVFQI